MKLIGLNESRGTKEQQSRGRRNTMEVMGFFGFGGSQD